MPTHYLRKNEASRVPSSIVFVDTETRPTSATAGSPAELHMLRLGVAEHWRRRKGEWNLEVKFDFQTRDAFWAWLYDRLQARHSVWLVAHNLGFDATILGLWQEIEAGRLKLRAETMPKSKRAKNGKRRTKPFRGAIITSDHATYILAQHRHGRIHFVDSTNYFPVSLETLGKGLGLRKLPMPAFSAPDSEWLPYCATDVEILRRVFLQTLERWAKLELGNWTFTGAGLAWHSFRHTMQAPFIVINHDDRHTKLARESYFGGEVRLWFYGRIAPQEYDAGRRVHWLPRHCRGRLAGPVYHVDMKSAYASILRDERFPINWKCTVADMTPRQLVDKALVMLPIGEALIDSAANEYPVRIKGKTEFRHGQFWTTLAGPELVAACEAGDVKRLGRVAWYVAGRPFAGFVDFWLDQRRQAAEAKDDVWDGFCKSMCNSLVGKFGARRRLWQDRPELVSLQPWGQFHVRNAQTGVIVRRRAIAGHVQEQVELGEGKESFCAIAAFVNAHCRMRMKKIRAKMPARSALWQHTDGLVITGDGFDAICAAGIIDEGRPGFIGVKKIAEYGAFLSPYHVILEERPVRTGIKFDAVPGKKNLIAETQFEGLAGVFAHKGRPAIEIKRIVKEIQALKPAGKIDADGFLTMPALNQVDLVPF